MPYNKILDPRGEKLYDSALIMSVFLRKAAAAFDLNAVKEWAWWIASSVGSRLSKNVAEQTSIFKEFDDWVNVKEPVVEEEVLV